MNTLFVLLRLLNYLILLGFTLYSKHPFTWVDWAVSLVVVTWGTWDLWKKPNEETKFMSYGVWLEGIAVTCWVVTIQSDVLLFAYISPLARASIHLSFVERALIWIFSSFATLFIGGWMTGTSTLIPLIVSFLVMAYSSIVASLVSERERAQRLMALSEFEKEQRIRDQERIRVSRQLHDTMGQYWIAVIRTIDVAEAVELPEKQIFIKKARSAAEQGLEEMRKIVRNWNDGKQTPEQWIDFALKSIERLRELTNIGIELEYSKVEWVLFDHPGEISELVARTIIESLSNSIRHGKATKIWVHIHEQENVFKLIIRDNGIGFSNRGNTDTHQVGIGFRSLEEMTREIGGRIQIKSAPYRGATIDLIIPFQKKVMREGRKYD